MMLNRKHLAAAHWWLAVALVLAVAPGARAQEQPPPKPTFTVYGFAMLDIGHNFTQIDPNWYDTLRVTKLPSYADQFGKNNSTFSGVRQSRFGVKSSTPTAMGDLVTKFEFDMFGTGVDAGQTTFRLRHAWGELGQFGAGQSDSPFEDPDVWPNSVEYWGPTGQVFFRNIQVRWTPLKGEKTLMLAIERPGASGDQGIYSDRIELQNIKGRFPLPDFTGAFKYSQKWGYVRAGWALRRIQWDDVLQDQFDLSGKATGWGLNLSSCLNASKNDVIRLEYVYGRGIENYMNDSPIDIGIQKNLANTVTPILGKPLPVTAVLAFVDHNWNSQFSSSFGYSMQNITNSNGQAANAFHQGHYALGNVLYTPVPNVTVGGELQWGRRVNNSDGFHSDGVKVQFLFKYNFSQTFGG